ncbi:MAG: hypothetical protein IIY48_08030 [Clostridia bacterium]|nr:hypothetical protein [Clostridia bacterium]
MKTKEKTVCIIGAILVALILHHEVLTWLILAGVLAPVAVKVIELGHMADSGQYRDYNKD